jgi:hypothetical protein
MNPIFLVMNEGEYNDDQVIIIGQVDCIICMRFNYDTNFMRLESFIHISKMSSSIKIIAYEKDVNHTKVLYEIYIHTAFEGCLTVEQLAHCSVENAPFKML